MDICWQTVVNLFVEQVAAFLTKQDKLLNVAKLVFNPSRQVFSRTRWNEMKRVTSKLLVFPVGRGAGLGFRRVGIHVISKFCIRNRKARGGKMVTAGGEFPVKPEGADIRCILITHAMRHKGSVRNGHKILKGFTASPADRKSTRLNSSHV